MVTQGTIRPGWEYRWLDKPTRLLSLQIQNNSQDTGFIQIRISRDNVIMAKDTGRFIVEVKGYY